MYPARDFLKQPGLKRPADDEGFTLIELLVAITIFAIGMLALAALQGQGLKYNSNAYERSQAVLLASDIADRIRANVDTAGTNAFNYGAIASPPVAASPPCLTVACSCVSATCTAAQMAAADSFEWLTLVAQTLPGGTGSVTCSSGAGACAVGDTYLVNVSWTGRFGASSHSLSVRP